MIWKLPLAIFGVLLIQWKVQEIYPELARCFDLFVLLAIWVGIKLQPTAATFAGASIGLIQDIFSVSPMLGFNGVGKALIAFTFCLLTQRLVFNLAVIVPLVVIVGILELFLRQSLHFIFLEKTPTVNDPFTLPLVNAILFLPVAYSLLQRRQDV